MSKRMHVIAAATAVGMMAGGSSVSYTQTSAQAEPPVASETRQTPAATAQADPDEQQPVFRTGINFVRVDVIVTDRDGNPVVDLEPEDFEVLEDGVPQSIETFRLVQVADVTPGRPDVLPPVRSESQVESAAARDDVRLIAIFLDDYHVKREMGLRVREPLVNFIQKRLGPNDLVALMYPLTPVSALRFTNNHASIVRAIESFVGRKYEYTPQNEQEQRYAFYPTAVVERIRNEVSLSAIRSLTYRLGALREGRKAIILVSEGFSNLVPPELRDSIASAPGYSPGGPNSSFNSQPEGAAELAADVDIQNELRRVYDAANRNNAAIYALDPRGLAVFEYSVERPVSPNADIRTLGRTLDTLRILANQTDGRAIVNQNDLERGLRQIVTDSSTYYLIGYSSTETPSDGEFHEIKVKVSRPRVEVRARKGYWALTAEEVTRALRPASAGPPPAVTRALGAIAEPPHGRIIRVWVGTARAENGRTRVTFVWEPRTVVSGAPADSEAPARVSLIAAANAGRAYFRGRVPDVALTSPAGGGAGPGSGASRVEFEADPGPMSLRVAIEGTGGGVIDREMRKIEVPDFTGPQVSLSTPAVHSAGNAFEFRQLEADENAVPVATRDFSRVDRLLVRFELYGPGNVAATAARLLNRAGDAMMDIPVRSLEQGRHEVELLLSSLPTGEYLVEITGTANGHAATELVAFRVQG